MSLHNGLHQQVGERSIILSMKLHDDNFSQRFLSQLFMDFILGKAGLVKHPLQVITGSERATRNVVSNDILDVSSMFVGSLQLGYNLCSVFPLVLTVCLECVSMITDML